jgi:broad specificity phosphatase PhoE
MRLILVRHGETEWNREYRVQGLRDIPLNDFGRVQAEAIATTLKDEAVEAIYTSPLQRALETANSINQFHQVEIIILDGLKELNVGELDGLYSPEMKSKYPDFYQSWKADAASARMPGGESLPELQDRVWASIQSILDKSGKLVIVVSHFFSLLSLLCKVFDLSLSEFRRFNLMLGSISMLEFSEEKAKLVSFNDTCHLGISY